MRYYAEGVIDDSSIITAIDMFNYERLIDVDHLILIGEFIPDLIRVKQDNNEDGLKDLICENIANYISFYRHRPEKLISFIIDLSSHCRYIDKLLPPEVNINNITTILNEFGVEDILSDILVILLYDYLMSIDKILYDSGLYQDISVNCNVIKATVIKLEDRPSISTISIIIDIA